MNEAEARQLLAVEGTASKSELKSAYRRNLKTCHPDLFDPDSASYADAISNTQRINEAYQFLGGKIGKRKDVAWAPYAPPNTDYFKNPFILWGGLILAVAIGVIIERVR